MAAFFFFLPLFFGPLIPPPSCSWKSSRPSLLTTSLTAEKEALSLLTARAVLTSPSTFLAAALAWYSSRVKTSGSGSGSLAGSAGSLLQAAAASSVFTASSPAFSSVSSLGLLAAPSPSSPQLYLPLPSRLADLSRPVPETWRSNSRFWRGSRSPPPWRPPPRPRPRPRPPSPRSPRPRPRPPSPRDSERGGRSSPPLPLRVSVFLGAGALALDSFFGAGASSSKNA
mmetsp:Transcript_2277/g.3075  ORF Transcript_2277/g.3075 Transcript_2277/m.3075 type:complete len:227 (-) Transcript_2277:52-732(-)